MLGMFQEGAPLLGVHIANIYRKFRPISSQNQDSPDFAGDSLHLPCAEKEGGYYVVVRFGDFIRYRHLLDHYVDIGQKGHKPPHRQRRLPFSVMVAGAAQG